MNCVQTISRLALRRLLPGACDNPAFSPETLGAPGNHLTRALRQGNAWAWVGVEVVLAGEALWVQLQLAWERSLDADFYQPLRQLLDKVPRDGFTGPETTRPAWATLRRAVQAGLLTSGPLDALMPTCGPSGADEGEQLRQLAAEMEAAGYGDLKPVFDLRCGDSALLVVLAAASFRHAVETDPDLFPGLSLDPRLMLTEALPVDGRALSAALDRHRQQLEGLLAEARKHHLLVNAPSPTAPPDGRVWTERGRDSARRGDFDGAITEFTAALQTVPGLVDAYLGRADAYRANGEYPQALEDYSAALQYDPDNLRAFLHRAQTYWLLEEPEAAIADHTAALRLDPNSAVAYAGRAKARLEGGDTDGAIDDLDHAIRLDSNNAWAYHLRGDAYAARGDLESACDSYTQALRLDPLASLTYVRRGDVHRRDRRLAESVADYSSALRLDPRNVTAYLHRAQAHLEGRDFDHAGADLNAALKMDPANTDVLRQRGILHRTLAQFDRSLVEFDQALAHRADDGDLYYQRGLSHQARGDLKAALADFDRANELDPQLLGVRAARGQVNAARGKFEHALADFSAAVAADPDRADTYWHRANVLAQAGRFAEARQDCDEALARNPLLVPAHVLRARALAELGQPDEALASLDRALGLETDNADARYLRASLYANRNELRLALADYGTYLRLCPREAEAYSKRAALYLKSGNLDRALEDLGEAAHLNPRFAAAYMKQLAVAHTVRGRFARAAADYAIAQLLAPDDTEIKAARERVLRLKDAAKVLAPTLAAKPATPRRATPAKKSAPPKAAARPARAPEPAGPKDDASFEVTVFEDDLVRLDVAVEPPAPMKSTAAATVSHRLDQLETAETLNMPTEEAGTRRAKRAAAEAETEWPAQADEDEAKQAALEEKRRLAEEKVLAEREAVKQAEAERLRKEHLERQQKAEEAERKKKQSKRRKRGLTDDEREDRRELVQQWLVRAAMAAGVLVVAYFGWQLFKPGPKGTEKLRSDVVWEAFKNDPENANQKYANKRVLLVGKLEILPAGMARNPLVFFQPPKDGEEPKISCEFASPGDVAELPPGPTPVSYLVSGEFAPYQTGPVIQFKNCEFLGPTLGPTAVTSAADFRTPLQRSEH